MSGQETPNGGRDVWEVWEELRAAMDEHEQARERLERKLAASRPKPRPSLTLIRGGRADA